MINNKSNNKSNKKLNNKSNKKLNKKTSKKTSKKVNNKSNKKLNKKSNIKPNKKLNKKGGNNESINSNIVTTEVDLETVNITKEQFKKLLLINTFYEIYSNILDKEDDALTLISTTSVPTENKKRPHSRISNNSQSQFSNPINPLKNKRIYAFDPYVKRKKGGALDEYITEDINEKIFLLLSYLDNVHDFAGNNRCKINKEPSFFKDYIKYLYKELGLNTKLMEEYDHKEGIILYKMLENYPEKYKNMVFKMNKNYAKNLPTLSRNIGEKNEYIVQILDDKTIPKENECILYDSPVYRLNDYDLVNKKNYISTSIEIKDYNIITTPPEKLFDSATGYKKGLCISKTSTRTPNISLNYNTYPLFNILNKDISETIPNEIKFEKESDKLCYMQNCGIYNLNSGYSVRQLKEWIVENINHFKSNNIKVTNQLKNSEYMSKLTKFINKLLEKLINISKFNELNTKNKDLLLLYIAMSIKRLGDWGMVERNIIDNNIFITNDTLCALYAILRDSKLIFHVPSTYSKKLKGPRFMEDISGKNMGLIGFYNLNGDEIIEPIKPNPELDNFIRKEANIIKNTINLIGGEEINSDIKFISQNL